MNTIPSNIDPATLHLLRHQGRRMHAALHRSSPPDRKLAAQIQKNVDDILDRRPRAIAANSSGEVLFAGPGGVSPWVAAQAIRPGLTTAVNATGEPERVLPAKVAPEPVLPIGDEIIDGPGGVAVLDRESIHESEPGDGRPRAPLTEDEVRRFGHELGGEA